MVPARRGRWLSFADPTDSNVVYTEWQNGSVVRVDRRTNERTTIKPEAAEGEPRLRWNWNAPLIMSPHDPEDVVHRCAEGVSHA